jgi:ketosteroid isomerase-like protein
MTDMQRPIYHLALATTVVLMIALTAAGCGSAGDEASPQDGASTVETAAPQDASNMNATDVTREVVQRHLRTFGEGDLEAVLADYADDAVMFTPDGPIVGKEALRVAFEALIAEWSQPGTTFEMTQESYEGEHGYINWRAETAENVYEYGIDGFTVRDGKIVAQFYGEVTTPKTP